MHSTVFFSCMIMKNVIIIILLSSKGCGGGVVVWSLGRLDWMQWLTSLNLNHTIRNPTNQPTNQRYMCFWMKDLLCPVCLVNTIINTTNSSIPLSPCQKVSQGIHYITLHYKGIHDISLHYNAIHAIKLQTIHDIT